MGSGRPGEGPRTTSPRMLRERERPPRPPRPTGTTGAAHPLLQVPGWAAIGALSPGATPAACTEVQSAARGEWGGAGRGRGAGTGARPHTRPHALPRVPGAGRTQPDPAAHRRLFGARGTGRSSSAPGFTAAALPGACPPGTLPAPCAPDARPGTHFARKEKGRRRRRRRLRWDGMHAPGSVLFALRSRRGASS